MDNIKVLPDDMNIVMASDKVYAKYALVTLYSLFKNNARKVNVFYYFSESMEEELEELKNLTQRYGNSFYPMSAKLRTIKMEKAWGMHVWNRWLCLEELAPICERALVLGCDILIKEDITEFYNQELQEKFFVLGHHMLLSTIWTSPRIREDARKHGADLLGAPCVTLVNLKKAHTIVNVEKMLELYEGGKFVNGDQDVFNYCLKDYIKITMPQECFVPAYEYNYCPDYHTLEKRFNSAKIIHYIMADKPWRVYAGKLEEDLWISYAKDVIRDIDWEEFKKEHLKKSYYEYETIKILKSDAAQNGYMFSKLCEDFLWNGMMISWFKRENIRNMAIYGTGSLGRSFCGFIKRYTNIQVKYWLDSYKEGEIFGIDIISIAQAEKRNDIDVLVLAVAPIWENGIKKGLGKLDVDIISLEELFNISGVC